MQSLTAKKAKDEKSLDYPMPSEITPMKKKSSKIIPYKKPMKRQSIPLTTQMPPNS